MSIAVFQTRLFWQDRRGAAKHNGVLVELRNAPQVLPGVTICDIDYAPEVRVASVRPFALMTRDLTREEILTINQWLERMSSAARTAMEAPSVSA